LDWTSNSNITCQKSKAFIY